MSKVEKGRAGEDLAAAWYESRGYRVLDRNWRIRQGEIDLVVAAGGTVVFCEVKLRSSKRFGSGAEAVDRRKQRQVRNLALAWLQQSERRYPTVRFDVVSIDGGDNIEVIEGCF